jgi:hypothetical protein
VPIITTHVQPTVSVAAPVVEASAAPIDVVFIDRLFDGNFS